MNIQPFNVEVEEGLTLRGSLYEPQGGIPQSTRVPAAILFHGFGGNRVDFSGFIVRMAKALSEAGIAVVTYDRAGHGESDGEFFDTSVSRDVRHALKVVDAVSNLDFVDATNLHLGGLSLGSVIATMVAPKVDSSIRVRSLTLCSIAGVFVDEIKGGKIQGMPLDSLQTKGYFDFLGMKMGPAMVRDAETLDIYDRARGFSGKVLLMHGTKDFVPLEYPKGYAKVYGDNATLLIREGADHGWGTVPDREFVMSHATQFVRENAFQTTAK